MLGLLIKSGIAYLAFNEASDLDDKHLGGKVGTTLSSGMSYGWDKITGGNDAPPPATTSEETTSPDVTATDEPETLDQLKSAYDQAMNGNILAAAGTLQQTVSGDNDTSTDNEDDGMPFWMKALGIGSGTLGGGLLLKSLFSSKDDNNSNSNHDDGMGWFSKLLIAATVVGAVVMAYKNFDKITGLFNEQSEDKNTAQLNTGAKAAQGFTPLAATGFGATLGGAHSTTNELLSSTNTPLVDQPAAGTQAPIIDEMNTGQATAGSFASQIAQNDGIRLEDYDDKPSIFRAAALNTDAPTLDKVAAGHDVVHHDHDLA